MSKGEDELKLVEFLKENELMDYKVPRGRPYGINIVLSTTWSGLPVREISRPRGQCMENYTYEVWTGSTSSHR